MPSKTINSPKGLFLTFLLLLFCTNIRSQNKSVVDNLLALLPAKDGMTHALIPNRDLQKVINTLVLAI